MGLFDKKFCCLCGQKAGLLSRQKILNKQYLCGDCAAKCSEDMDPDQLEEMSVEDVKAHIAYMEANERAYQDEFEQTKFITTGGLAGKLLSIDENHGWWVRANSDSHTIYGIGDVTDCHVELETSRLPEDERRDDPPRRSLLLDLLEDEPEFLHCPPGRKIDNMVMEIRVNHPWVREVKIDLTDSLEPDGDEVRRAYEAAEEIMDFFREHEGEESTPIGEEG